MASNKFLNNNWRVDGALKKIEQDTSGGYHGENEEQMDEIEECFPHAAKKKTTKTVLDQRINAYSIR